MPEGFVGVAEYATHRTRKSLGWDDTHKKDDEAWGALSDPSEIVDGDGKTLQEALDNAKRLGDSPSYPPNAYGDERGWSEETKAIVQAEGIATAPSDAAPAVDDASKALTAYEAAGSRSPYSEEHHKTFKFHAVCQMDYGDVRFYSAADADSLSEAISNIGVIKKVLAVFHGDLLDFYEKRKVVLEK